jgi:outer membrane biosynthesis protein TonB
MESPVMPRLATLLIAAVLAVGFGSLQLAQSQTEAPPPAGQTAPKAKKALTPEEKAERKAKRQAMTPEEKAKLKQERAAKKEAKAAKKAKRQDCLAKGKQDNLKGKQLREFLQTCTAG